MKNWLLANDNNNEYQWDLNLAGNGFSYTIPSKEYFLITSYMVEL
jgi:hypothetical protein